MATDHDAIIHRDATGLVIKDSGKRQEFDTGARRDVQDGKGRFDLMPPWALEMVSKLYEAGCRKYGDRNWEKGIPICRYLDSAIRHTLKYLRGDDDEDHLVAACWNLLCCLDTRERIKLGILPPSLDDRPKYVIGKHLPKSRLKCPSPEPHQYCDQYPCDECREKVPPPPPGPPNEVIVEGAKPNFEAPHHATCSCDECVAVRVPFAGADGD